MASAKPLRYLKLRSYAPLASAGRCFGGMVTVEGLIELIGSL